MNDLLKKIDALTKRLFSSTRQVQRIVILTGIALVLATVTFAAYYYFDRYYTDQPTVQEQTVEQAEQAVRDDPQSAEKRFALAEAYMTYARWDEAENQALQLRQMLPDDVRVDFILGICYASNGRPADALEPLTKFIDSQKDGEMLGLNRRYQAALYYLGDSYLQLGQPENAVVPLQEGVNLSKTDADALYKLGVAYNGIGDYEAAIETFYRAVTFVPDYVEVYEAMIVSFEAINEPALVQYANGMIAYCKKDYNSALSQLQTSAEAQPEFVPTFVGLGQTYEALNDLQNAKASYEAALLLDPNNFSANNNLQRVNMMLGK